MNQLFSKIWIIVILVIIIAGGFFAWQYFGGREEVKETEELTLESIRNAEYYNSTCETFIRLKDGFFEESDYPCGGDVLLGFLSRIDYTALGDLNNDKRNDAAVILTSNYGGSGGFRELAVIINQNGELHHITSRDLGDRVIINSLIIESGIITIDMIVHGSDDAMCCPTLKKLAKYKLVSTELVEMMDETANWKTYRNEEHGFELKYPEGWELRFWNPELKMWILEFELEGQLEEIDSDTVKIRKETKIGKYYYHTELQISVANLGEEEIEIPKTELEAMGIKTETGQIGGLEAFKVFFEERTYKENNITVREEDSVWQLQTKERFYMLGIDAKEEVKTFDNNLFIINQILSTFRFLE